MDRLWAPWRLAYVTAAPPPSTDCIFCDALNGAGAELTVFRARHSFIILNLYPYNNGHLMVVPNRHLKALALLTPDEQAELMKLTRLSEMALTETYHPQGINVGINLGKAAGAGIENHLHVHLVPRWEGDTSFMTAVGQTRVIPEDLRQTASRLRPIFDRLAKDGS
jgi:ATP adenylyltransferase